VVEASVRAPRLADVDALLANLRPADAAEVEAARGPDLRHAVLRALALSTRTWAAEVDGRLMLLAGVAPLSLLDGIGTPWTLGTREIDRRPGAFIRLGRAYIPRMRELFPTLVNHVDARNTRSIRWLKRMGFVLAPAEPYGVAGLPFHPFHMGVEHVRH